MSWFPRAATAEQIDVVGSHGLDAHALWALMSRSDGELWKHRVGVAGAQDGSAKATVRLLHSDGMVFKTDLSLRMAERHAAVADVEQRRRSADELGLWHPDKQWFAVAHQGGWLVMSVCPRLTTLRELQPPRARLDSWIQLLLFACRVTRRHGIGLDLNPANFGRCSQGTLYYIDDEWYPEPTRSADVGDFVAARLVEEDALSSGAFAWASSLATALRGEGFSPGDLSDLAAAVEDYPLPSRRTSVRKLALRGLRARRSRESSGPPRGGRTCILADIHANLPALEAVLAAVEDVDVDEYLILGDVVGYGPHPAQCIERIQALPSTRLVRGNHDQAVAEGLPNPSAHSDARWVVSWTISQLRSEQRDWLGAMPLEVAEPGMLAVHGAPRDPRRLQAYVYQLTYRENLSWLEDHRIPLCFFGHTHVPLAYACEGSDYRTIRPRTLHLEDHRLCLVNPGSVGQPRDGDTRAAFAMWDRPARRLRFHRVPYAVETTLAAMQRHHFPADLMHRLCVAR